MLSRNFDFMDRSSIRSAIMLSACVWSMGSNVVSAKDPGWTDKEWSRFTNAIRQVETGGEPNDGIGTIGDGGDSIGPLQIQEACFIDAIAYDPSIKGKWEDCLSDLELSRRVCLAYIKRYAPSGATPKVCARIWNGGPKGHKKKATEPYAEKFKKVFDNS